VAKSKKISYTGQIHLKAGKEQKPQLSKASSKMSKVEMLRLIHQLEDRRIEVETQQSALNQTNLNLIEQNEALKTLNYKLGFAANSGKVGIWDWNLITNDLEWNDQMYLLYGINENSFSGTYEAWQSGLHPEDKLRSENEINKAVANKEEFNTEFRVVWPDNSIHYIRALAQVQCNISGDAISMIGTNWDITETKLKEEKLKESERSLKEAQTIAKIGNWNLNTVTNEPSWSAEIYTILGLPNDGSINDIQSAFINLLSSEDQAIVLEALNNTHETGESFSIVYKIQTPSGEKFIHNIGNQLKDENGVIIGVKGIMQDITELRNTQENLELYRMMIENSKDPIFMIDDEDDCRMIYVNEAARSHFGKPLEEIYTWRIPDWDPGFTYNDLSKHVEDFKKIGHLDIESRHKINDGQIVPVEMSLNKFVYNGRLCHFGYFKNITERKQKEQERQDLIENMNEKTALLESANKEMDSFSYSVSHDLRAPLRAINSFAEILALDFSKILPSEAKKHLERIRGNALKMGNLIDQLLAFSRLGRKTITKYQVDTAHIVTSIIREICIDHAAAKTFFKVGNMLPVPGDVALLKQVFTNLISNAYKYSHKNASPSIEIGSKHNSKEITYYIKDNGVGFDMRYYDKIFGIFQRLHSESEFEGTGVGLAIVLKIVTAHGGRVWAESKVNKGSCFYFTIPLDES
jgi:PAS domain S-box-containing protein